MTFQNLSFADFPRLSVQLATTSGHRCPSLAESRDRQRRSAIRSFFVIGSYSRLSIGIVRALLRLCEPADTLWTRRTPQPTSSERPKAQKTRAAPSVVRKLCLPILNLSIGERL